MGAWAADPFGNDTACDWGYRLSESDDTSGIVEALQAATECDGFIDADIGSEAVAACEVLARLKGNWGERTAYTETVDQWIENHPIAVSTELAQLASDALTRVLAPDSELAELWAEAEDHDWVKSIEELRRRIL
jgi:hypothetical protein